jgi:di/tricarboxylate transporter
MSDKISNTAIFFAITATIIFIIAWLINVITMMDAGTGSELYSDIRTVCRKWMLRTLILAPMLWMLWAFIPNRQDLLLIIAGGAVGNFVTTDENAKEIPADITKFLRKEILEATVNSDDYIKETLGIKATKDTLISKSKEELIELLKKK